MDRKVENTKEGCVFSLGKLMSRAETETSQKSTQLVLRVSHSQQNKTQNKSHSDFTGEETGLRCSL